MKGGSPTFCPLKLRLHFPRFPAPSGPLMERQWREEDKDIINIKNYDDFLQIYLLGW